MKPVRYKISIKGLPTPSGSITFSVLRRTIDVLCEGSERALRLALEGASIKTGRTPSWLSKSTDFVLRGVRRGSTSMRMARHNATHSAVLSGADVPLSLMVSSRHYLEIES